MSAQPSSRRSRFKPAMLAPRFVGVDLAWGERKPSAIVILQLEDDGVARPVGFSSGLETVEEICEFILRHTHGSAFIALDAPIVVPNIDGGRPCDSACTSQWGDYDVEALPANQKQCGDPPRGGRLMELLADAAFDHRYDIEPGEPGRAVFEVLTQPASVALFKLSKMFRYKRSATVQNQEGLAAFQKKILSDLDRLTPAVELEADLGGRLLRSPIRLKGAEFERQSDLVGAIMCATISFHYWHWGGERWEALGSTDEGAILVPRLEAYADEDAG